MRESMKFFRLPLVFAFFMTSATYQAYAIQSQSSDSMPTSSPSSSASSENEGSSNSTLIRPSGDYSLETLTNGSAIQNGAGNIRLEPVEQGLANPVSSRSQSSASAPAPSSSSGAVIMPPTNPSNSGPSGKQPPELSLPEAKSQGQKSQNSGNISINGSQGVISVSSGGVLSASGSIMSAPSSARRGPSSASGTAARSSNNKASGSNQAIYTAPGAPNAGQSGEPKPNNGSMSDPSGDYGLETLPVGSPSASASQPGLGNITSAERAALLDDRLRRGYEAFDGFILGERERAQNESNEAGSVAIGSAGGQRQPQTMEEAATAQASGVAAVGSPPTSSGEPQQTFPPPEDIPSGRDDDVVARQLREAAMREPDPKLREALWDEYRNYTGIALDQ
tara:strand:- start:2927 stop:4105 length:1179 start_codon:yes stop_codon:yes gene_type:complete